MSDKWQALNTGQRQLILCLVIAICVHVVLMGGPLLYR